MVKTRKRYELFELEWLMMRQNPGGVSAIVLGYLLGFNGTANIADALNSDKKAKLKIKIGNGETQLREVSFNGCDPQEITVLEAVKALNAAGFTDCEFSVDKETNRLKLAQKGKKARFTQIYGDLAAALRFGNCRLNEGKGCYIYPSFDGDLKSANETEQWGEDKKIENDSDVGKKVTYIIAGKRGSTQVVITDRLASYEAKQMINGGVWIDGDADNPETFEPPVDDSGDARSVDVLTFSRLLDRYETNAGSEAFVLERMYIGGVGHMAKSGGSGSMKDSEYTLTFGSYIGDDGKEHASPKESNYTFAQWEALQMQEGVLELDWAEGMSLPESVDEPSDGDEPLEDDGEESDGGEPDDEEPGDGEDPDDDDEEPGEEP